MGGQPLGHTGAWTATDGRRWRTECDTAVTGRNGCRSYTWTTYVKATSTGGRTTFSTVQGWVVNNIVRFKA
ncbi:hypothetical protein G7085_14435 [Tessaracoccus sp. HDW20]|uniref:hypothetical protein n=1 Tax=Tessaracoccus coleopterorum TaxID=2714950 RepID=UPI0018D3B8EE|nr:hypothetical protein [Tessaracoccus coleopterorum]NHB85411.1 hypothetical protein [Tessaracoccus coleopterorum]